MRPSFTSFRPSESPEEFPPSTTTPRTVPSISSYAPSPSEGSAKPNVTLSQSPAQVQMQTTNPMYHQNPQHNNPNFAADMEEDEGEQVARLSRFAVPIIPSSNAPPSIYR